jgi:hypothetical protein
MLFLSAIVSGFNAAGVGAHNSMNNYNLDEQQWHNITSNITGPDDKTTYDKYDTGSNAMTEFITGTVYVKGVIDDWSMDNPLIGVFSTGIQAGIYFLAIIGALAWALNRTGA